MMLFQKYYIKPIVLFELKSSVASNCLCIYYTHTIKTDVSLCISLNFVYLCI